MYRINQQTTTSVQQSSHQPMLGVINQINSGGIVGGVVVNEGEHSIVTTIVKQEPMVDGSNVITATGASTSSNINGHLSGVYGGGKLSQVAKMDGDDWLSSSPGSVPSSAPPMSPSPSSQNHTYNTNMSNGYSSPMSTGSYDPYSPTNKIGDTSMLQKILYNQQILMNKLDKMDFRLSNIEMMMKEKNNKRIDASEAATNKLISENLVYTKKTARMLKSLTGDEKTEMDAELEAIFPIKNFLELNDVEARIQSNLKFTQALTTFLRKFKTERESIQAAFRYIGTDDLYSAFNLVGLSGKHALWKYKLFSKILFDSCGTVMGVNDYKIQLRNGIVKSHNRFYKMKSLNKLKQTK